MGVWKKHAAAYAVESRNLYSDNPNNAIAVPTFMNIDGTQTNTTLKANYGANTSFCGMVPTATGDDILNYSVNDYSITAVGTTTTTSTPARTVNGMMTTYTIPLTVTNGTENAVIVKCVRFKKYIYDVNGVSSYYLMFSYYLDNPVTIPAGGSHSMSISLTSGADV